MSLRTSHTNIKQPCTREHENQKSNVLISQFQVLLRSRRWLWRLEGDVCSVLRPTNHYGRVHIEILCHDKIWSSLTSQPPSGDKGLMPLGRFDIEKVEKHVKDHLLKRGKMKKDNQWQHRVLLTLVSSDGIRNPSTKARNASLLCIE